ncbi:Fumarate hydratase class II 1 [Vibrio nigripulchritudo SFn27]|uniref:Fumarate hydratase class II n=1 Tax=Vibrio nigripulchritudo TaxID=28173 RepID=U4K666_9VIBR|nr:class II fumarate hydratase [Vibrio nigripulchritudo]CCN33631.1 Fumarate hydratase class II 1 [Vibrio nigripulchritudo AM115]CCN41999.1 Fumarate hydratase class II 1 [Vibrio nigripulchritudo FTn2]CCN67065.1 Fumarate hydratase class II 1 [Vibrio nigripulchritudo POn4]CCN68374.1 Fumarate hydratase class II 1 [Vibrio nigripulchritudo SFn118]CCN78774.1 Fumarate hydratase class II 1 [Vibrio nigripulchritudo SO65]
MTTYRIEKDSMGEVQVPEAALYQAQTQRAVDNFPISGITMPAKFIQALAFVKQAAAKANAELNLLEQDIADAISESCQEIIDGQHIEQFPVDVFQTGSGTSSNMNANEVIATLASQKAGKAVNPNDHVNMGQSSNDVVPTAIAVSAALAAENQLVPALKYLSDKTEEKAKTLEHVVKTGRTHLMDAMPVTLAQELRGWKFQIDSAINGIQETLPRVKALAQGGTAVGTGINAVPEFSGLFAKHISASTGVSFQPSENFFYNMSSQDAIVSLSGQLKTGAVAIMKIANDLRWMNSGPLAGLGEIELQALQPGSSIMPGKVNPVIPEAAAMVAAQVIGNDTTITIGGQSGNFQLNVMLPVIGLNIIQSIELLANASTQLADKAVSTFAVREDNLQVALAKNPILVTALNPVIGYLKAAEVAKKAYKEQRAIIDVAEEETDLSREELEKLLDPAKLTQGGIAQ